MNNFTFISSIALLILVGIFGAMAFRRPIGLMSELADFLKAYSKGNFYFNIDTEKFKNGFRILKNPLKELQDSMRKWVHQILKSSVEISLAAQEINRKSVESDNRIDILNEKTSKFLQDVSAVNDSISNCAAISQELYSSNNELAETSGKAIKSTQAAAENIENSISSLKRAVNLIEERSNEIRTIAREIFNLQDISKKIVAISDSINDISQQINLLSLNASIEAARAGISGSGFVVVANEIKKLAGETSSFSKEIVELVDRIAKSIKSASELMEGTVKKMGMEKEITDEAQKGIGSITSSINEIQNLIDTISESLKTQSLATEQMTNNIQEVANFSTSLADTMKTIESILNEQREYIKTNTRSSLSLLNTVNELEEFSRSFDDTLGKMLLKVAESFSEIYAREKEQMDIDRLKEVIKKFGVTELSVTDEDGVVILNNVENRIGFRFPDDEKTQAGEFRKILKDRNHRVVQKLQKRSIDGRIFKYVGVSRKDQKGIIQAALSIDDIFKLKI